MAGFRVRPDDDIRRVRNVWLGPTGMTWPVAASYTAWGLFVSIFVGIVLIEALSPMKVSVIPSWEIAISMLLATAISGLVDHDKPMTMLPRVALQHARSPRRKPRPQIDNATLKLRVRTRS